MRRFVARLTVLAIMGTGVGLAAAVPASASCLTVDGTGYCGDPRTVTVGGEVLGPQTVGGTSVPVTSPTTVCLLVTCFDKGQPIATVPVPAETTPDVSVPSESVPLPIGGHGGVVVNECISSNSQDAVAAAKDGQVTTVAFTLLFGVGFCALGPV